MKIEETYVGYSIRSGIDYNKQIKMTPNTDTKYKSCDWVEIIRCWSEKHSRQIYFVKDTKNALHLIDTEAMEILLINAEVMTNV